MDKNELLRALRDSLRPESDNYSRAAEKTKSLGLDEAFFIHSISEPIAAALSAHSPFDGGAGFLVQADNGYTGFYANEAAVALSGKVLAGDTPEGAVAWLEKVLATDEARGHCILSLFGVEIASPVDLGHELALLPFQALPDSRTKAWLAHSLDDSVFSGHLLAMHAGSPRAALMTTHAVRPLLHPTTKGEPPRQTDPFRSRSLLDDARLALTLVGPSSPSPGGYWFEFEDRDLSDARHHGGVVMSTSLEEITPFAFTPPVSLDPEDSKHVASTFLALGEPLRSRLRLALRRLNQAIRRPPHGDRALDLAIALESILVEDKGENTYKIALRSALVLEVPLERRSAVRGIVTALYDLRSSLAHTGSLPDTVRIPKVGKRPSAAVVTEATEICATVLRAILEVGSIPDWFEYELGGSRGRSPDRKKPCPGG